MANERVAVTLEVTDSGAIRVLNQHSAALDKNKASAASAGQSIASTAKKIAAGVGVYLAARAAVRGLTNQLQETITVGAAFEQRMANIATLVGGDADRSVRQFTDGIQSLLRTIPRSADDLGASAYQIVSAGISDTADALKVLDASAKLGVAGLATTAESADILTSALNAFEISGEEANRTAEILFLTVKGGKTTVAELAQQFGAVAPIAATAGVRLEELQAATAALTTAGVATSEAQTNLRQAIVALLKPTEDMSKLLAGLGVESGKALIEQKGLVGAFLAVKDATNGSDEALARALGRVQGLTAVLSLSGAAGERFSAILEDIETNLGAFDDAFLTATETANNQIQLFQNSLDSIRIEVFTASADGLTAILRELTRVVLELEDGLGGLDRFMLFEVGPTFLDFADILSLFSDTAEAAVDRLRRALASAQFSFEDQKELNSELRALILDFQSIQALADRGRGVNVEELRAKLDELDIQIRGKILELQNTGLTLEDSTREALIAIGLLASESTDALDAAGQAAAETAQAVADLEAAFESIEDSARPLVDSQTAVLSLAQAQLEVARRQKAPAEEQLQLARAVDAATAQTHRLNIEILEQKIRAITVDEQLVALKGDELQALRDQITLERFLADTADATRIAVEASLDKQQQKIAKLTETVRIDLADAFREGMKEALGAVVAGTRDIGDVFEGLKFSIIRQFTDAFAAVIFGKKRQLDDPLQRNIQGIGGLFQGFAVSTVESFSQVFQYIGSGVGLLARVANAVGLTGAGGFLGANSAAIGTGFGVAGLGGLIGGKIGGPGGAIGGFSGGVIGTGLALAGVGAGISGAAGGAVLSGLGFAGVGSLTAGATGVAGIGAGAAVGAASAVAAAVVPVIGAVIGIILGTVIGNLLAPSNRDQAQRAVAQVLEQTLSVPVAEGAPTLSGRNRQGLATSDTARVLGLLLASRVESPFERIPEFKLFSESTGKIADTFDNFREREDEFARTLAVSLGGNIGAAIDAVQNEIRTIVDQVRGLTIAARPSILAELGDDVGRIFAEGGGGGSFLRRQFDRLQIARSLESEQAALTRLVEDGLLLPMDAAVKEIARLFTRDMPRAIRDGLDAFVDDEFARIRQNRIDGITGAFADPSGLTAEQIEGILEAEGLQVIQGDQIARLLEIQTEAFASLVEIMGGVAQAINASDLSRADQRTIVLSGVRDVVLQRAGSAVSEGFFQSASFDNLLAPIFTALDRGVQSILDAPGPNVAQQRIKELIESLGVSFADLKGNLGSVLPVIRQFAKLQEDLALALTTFRDVSVQAGAVKQSFDLLIAQIEGDPTVAANIAVAAASEARDEAVTALEDALGFSFTKKRGTRTLIRELSQSDPNAFKRLPELLAEAGQAIIANAEAEIAGLQARLQLTQQWVALLPNARAVLEQVTLFGRDETASNLTRFESSRELLGDLIRQFNTGAEAERIAAAQRITQLGPGLLELAQQAGFLPGSGEFETVRGTLESVLTDIVNEGAEREAEAINIQREIRDIQDATKDELIALRRLAEATETVGRRQEEILADIEGNTGNTGPVQASLEIAERTFSLLDRGINVVRLDQASQVGSEGAFPQVGLRTGGFVPSGVEVNARLHGPEVVVPLHQFPARAGSVNGRSVELHVHQTNNFNGRDEVEDRERARVMRRDLREALRDPMIQREIAGIAREEVRAN